MNKTNRFEVQSIQKRVRTGMILLITGIMTISTGIHINSQRHLLKNEFKQQIDRTRNNLVEQGRSMSHHLSLHTEEALASSNLSGVVEQLKNAVADTAELKYIILMDAKQTTHLHTLYPEKQANKLNTPHDRFAATVEAFTIKTVIKDKKKTMEFITPLPLGTQNWGVIRLGYSLENLKRMIVDSEQKIQKQTRTMIMKSALMAIIFTVFSAKIISILTARITAPLSALAKTANALSTGDFSHAEQLTIEREDEIGLFMLSFKTMAEKLKRSYDQLTNANQTLEKEVLKRTRDLSEARDLALQATEAKSQFLAGMSHDIRTPMNAILGMAELLWDSPLSPEQRKYVKIFQNSGKNLMTLLNDILDLERVESKNFKLQSLPFELHQEIQSCCELMALRAHTKKIELVLNIAPDIPTTLTGDAVRLKQIIMNLLENALKFTRKGEIEIKIRRNETHDISETLFSFPLLFSVRDTGSGIAPENLAHIFNAYTQAQPAATCTGGGNGLGLSICRHLTQLMGGEIMVESRLGVGSTFSFTALFDDVPHDDSPLHSPKIWIENACRIMVVDDNETALRMITTLLRTWGVTVESTATPHDAFSIIQQADHKGDPFDFALLDEDMPVTNGFTLAHRIRQGCHHPPTIILMLPTTDAKTKIKKAGKCSIPDYLFKPIVPGMLLAKISRETTSAHVEKRTSRVLETALWQPPPTILLAEDAEESQVIIKAFLKRTRAEITIAENGKVALEHFKKNRYDLVVMDIEMPVMDGKDAITAIRVWENKKGISPTPILALTAHAFQSMQRRCLIAGCDDYLVKPIQKKDLLNAIENLLKNTKHPPKINCCN